MYNPNIIIGAAVIAVIASGVYYYYNKSSKKETVEEGVAETIETPVVEVKTEEEVVVEAAVEVKEEEAVEVVKTEETFEEAVVEDKTEEEAVEVVEAEVKKEEAVRKNILLNLPAGSHSDLFKFVIGLKTSLKDHSEKEDVKEKMATIDSFMLSLVNNPKIQLKNCFKTNCKVAASFYYLQKNFTNEYVKTLNTYSKITNTHVILYKKTISKVK